MTEPSTPDTTGSAPESASPATGTPPEGDSPGEAPTDRQEARDERVRAERNELRAERDRLAGQVTTMRKAEIVRRADEHFHTPADLDLIVTAEQWAECFTDDGAVDEGAVAALFDSVKDQRPSWRKRSPHGGMDMGTYRTPKIGGTSWSSALRGG